MKCIVSDLDGTLLNQKKEILPIVTKALKRLKKKNCLFVVTTGRNYGGAGKLFASEIMPDYIVACNGAYVYDCKKCELLFERCISNESVHAILSEIEEVMKVSYLLTRDRYLSVFNSEDGEVFAFEEKIYKVEVHLKGELDGEQVVSKLRQAFPDLTIVLAVNTVNGGLFIEITPTQTSKSTGLETVLKHENIDSSEAIAFGDGYNDLSMFQYVGEKYAMKNAIDELKMISTDVIGSNQDGAVGFKILELIER